MGRGGGAEKLGVLVGAKVAVQPCLGEIAIGVNHLPGFMAQGRGHCPTAVDTDGGCPERGEGGDRMGRGRADAGMGMGKALGGTPLVREYERGAEMEVPRGWQRSEGASKASPRRIVDTVEAGGRGWRTVEQAVRMVCCIPMAMPAFQAVLAGGACLSPARKRDVSWIRFVGGERKAVQGERRISQPSAGRTQSEMEGTSSIGTNGGSEMG